MTGIYTHRVQKSDVHESLSALDVPVYPIFCIQNTHNDFLTFEFMLHDELQQHVSLLLHYLHSKTMKVSIMVAVSFSEIQTPRLPCDYNAAPTHPSLRFGRSATFADA